MGDGIGEGFQFLGLANDHRGLLAKICDHGRNRRSKCADLIPIGPGFELGGQIMMSDPIGRHGESSERLGNGPTHGLVGDDDQETE